MVVLYAPWVVHLVGLGLMAMPSGLLATAQGDSIISELVFLWVTVLSLIVGGLWVFGPTPDRSESP